MVREAPANGLGWTGKTGEADSVGPSSKAAEVNHALEGEL
ncbi:hypothetical protein AIIMSPaA1_047 [Pseudomonas phage AIIMS-Pa-A1]|uniref:Uncharacterized protein n=1 Tax=Pseudomonas phage AIIMS-Pa-A1 TaxID=2794941 RepID=A0A7T1TW37_9CAUD|nr:hypothetical protein AIIMSPaA1_047 [Pseudomonas phage AIIMS-Pa-A1]